MARILFRRSTGPAVFLAAALAVSSVAAQAPSVPDPSPTSPIPAPPAAVSLVPPAPAVTLDPTLLDSASLEIRLNTALKRWAARQNASQQNLNWRGMATVATNSAGSGYRITLPPLIFDAGDSDDLEVGSIAFTAQPQADGSFLLSDLAVPPEVVMRDSGGRPDFTLYLGSPAFSGVWVPQYENFRQIDLALSNLQGKPQDPEDGNLRIGMLRLSSTMAENGSFWSGPSSLSFQNILVIGPEDAEWLRLDQVVLGGEVVNLDMNRITALNTRVDTLIPVAAAPVSPVDPQALIDALEELQGVIGGLSTRFSLSGLTFRDPEEEMTIRLNGLEISSAVEGLDQDHSTWRAAYSHHALAIKPLPTAKEVIPQTLTIQVSATPMPNAALWKTLRGLLGTLVTDASQGQEVIDLLTPQVKETLAKAGSTFSIDTLHTETSSLHGDVTGKAVLNLAAPQGATASAKVVLTGLDATLKGLRPAKGAKPDPETQDLVAALTMAQALGQVGKDNKGRDTRTYNLELTADGRVLLNGADMSSLMGMETTEEKSAKPGKKK